MSVASMPSLSSVTNNVMCASSCVSKNDPINAENYLGLASGELTALKRSGIYIQETRELSAQIGLLNHQVTELYQKQKQLEIQAQRYVGVTTKTLFPIRVTYDAGFGNTLELRGSKAAGLSWEQGKALTCKDVSHWELDLDIQDSFEYKLVLRKADGAVVWENLMGNRTFSISDKTTVDCLKPIVPVFTDI